ncbi:putative uncharacterized protein [Prevotella sp. CAG:873]|nr:putative uncharacterized protein [Prevotella sp. CAG:873]
MVIALAAVAIMVAGTLCSASGQEHGPDMRLPSARENIYQGYNFVVDPETGDTMTIFFLRPFTVYPPMKFRNKKEEEFYWRTVRNVKVTLPYAKMIRETLIETYEYIETFDTQKEREQYLKRMEKELFKQYKPILKRLSKSQARLLVKLIQRETDQSSYEIVKAFLGSFRAVFWQGFGRLFGVNLRGKFQPEKKREDAIIERVATLVEQGSL